MYAAPMQPSEHPHLPTGFARLLLTLRKILRLLNGDTAYARYLEHWRMTHTGEGEPMSRAEFFTTETARRWNGVRRCC